MGPIGLLMKAQLIKSRRGPTVFTRSASPGREILEELAVLVATRIITPVVDRTFGLDDAAAALRCMESDHARRKVVVSLPSADANQASEG